MIPAGFDAMGAALVSWLLTYLVHSTILLSAAAAIAWRFPDHHAWLDLVWKAALIGPLVSATLQPTMAASPLGGRWSIANAPTVAAQTASAPSTSVTVEPSPVVDLPGAHSLSELPPAAPSVPTPTVDARAIASPQRWWPMLIALSWLGVAAIAVGTYLARLRNVYRTFTAATPVGSECAQSFRDVHEAAPAIALGVSESCQVPLALAGRRIVVPSRLFELDREQQRAAVAHEMAHVVRRDPEWLVAVELVTRAFFFQPLHRLARARMRDSAEFLCDQWAVQQTQAPLALAKCLSEVAAWSEGDRLFAGVSAMARNDSAMIKRVNRILNGATETGWRPRAWWVAIPVALVSVAAPSVTAVNMTGAVRDRVTVDAPSRDAGVVRETMNGAFDQQRREWTPSEVAAARAQLQAIRPARPGDPLDDRWRWALAEASRRRLSDFWMVYMFTTPRYADGLVMNDMDGSFVSSDGRISSSGPHLAMLDDTVMLEGGNLAVLVHYRGNAIDRAGYRSVGIGFDFGRTPVFWLGHAPEPQSFARVRDLFGEVRGEQLQGQIIELASIHSDSNAVIPFLTALVEPSRPAAIRAEAAEGFEHHHDPRSVQVLLRVARTDASSEVRTEAAETIGAVQTPESIAALTELVEQSADPDVRLEAAEAFGEQPASRALPAIEHLVAASNDEAVLGEAIEALGEFDDPGVVSILVQIANTHSNRHAQQEAVETLGDIEAAGRVEALTRIAWDHRDVVIQNEAVETLGDRHGEAAAIAALERIAREHPREDVQAEALETLADAVEGAIHPVVLDLAARGTTARVRQQALESIGDSADKLADPQELDAAQRAIARAVFDDPDISVQEEALDALEQLPGDRALSILRDVIDRHPDARMKREAEKQLRERRQ